VTARVAIVLHAHLPWLRLDEPWTLEERWLHEALWECYLPLLQMLARLERDGVTAPVTLSLSPTLIAMWRDPVLGRRFVDHLEAVRALNERHCAPEIRAHYRRLLDDAARAWRDHGADLPRAFAARRSVELTTTAATHALLPALRDSSKRRQLGLGRAVFEAATRRTPAGAWLPECGYDRRVDRALADLDIGHCVVAEHAVPSQGGEPIVSPTGVVVVPRDREATLRVWSPQTGYPAHALYREFHLDLAHGAPAAMLGPLDRGMTGLKLHRITAHHVKERYQPSPAAELARSHADDLLGWLSVRKRALSVLAFDAELFGHWWHEGLWFLERVLRGAASAGVELVPLSQAIDGHWAVGEASASTWGRGGDGHTWLGPETARHWRLVEGCARLVEAAWLDPVGIEAARDAARAQLVLEASDWPFLVDAGAAATFAKQRVVDLARRSENYARRATSGEAHRADETLPFSAAQIDRWFANGVTRR
jgi:1,4-alpha-glucan branching enzyme